MSTWNRQLWRIATRLEAAYQAVQQSHRRYSLPETAWHDARRRLGRLAIAEQRGWLHAIARERESVVTDLERIDHYVRELAALLENHPRYVPPTIRTLYEELLTVDGEFSDLKLTNRSLSVTTEPIELDGIQLGRFTIRLDLDELGSDAPYSVVALEPNPAASSSDTTHPHVSNDSLCAGEGRRPIATALVTGRLWDFFTIVDRILHTYTAGAAYVELNRWRGTPCHDCDDLLDEDNTHSCQSCDETLCGDCLICCCDCSTGYCSGCIESCPRCDLHCCTQCLAHCPRYRRKACSSCLADELCTNCQEELEREAKETFDKTPVEAIRRTPQPAI